MTELFNIVDYPTIIKVDKDSSLNIEDYKEKTGKNLYYVADCKEMKESKCVDDIFQEVPCVYDEYPKELNYFIERYKTDYSYLNKINRDDFETKEEIKEIINKMLEYQNKINEIKDLPTPPVDIDIIYSSFFPTKTAEFIDKDDLKEKSTVEKGGDQTVPTWSSLLTAFKWIYDIKINNLPQKVRLVEYCSRLSNKDIKLEIPNFKPISCQCLDENGYKDDLDKCSHQFMLSDENLFNYIFEEINNDEEIIDNKKNAMEKYISEREYLKECNSNLFNLINTDKKIKCSPDITISKEQFENEKYCSSNNFEHIDGKKCCSVYARGYSAENENIEFFDDYYCDNIKNDKDSKKNYINEMKLYNKFYDNVLITDVKIDCLSKYLISINKILFLLLLSNI